MALDPLTLLLAPPVLVLWTLIVSLLHPFLSPSPTLFSNSEFSFSFAPNVLQLFFQEPERQSPDWNLTTRWQSSRQLAFLVAFFQTPSSCVELACWDILLAHSQTSLIQNSCPDFSLPWLYVPYPCGNRWLWPVLSLSELFSCHQGDS